MARPPVLLLLLLVLVLCVGAAPDSLLDLQKRMTTGHGCGPRERWYHVQLFFNDGTRDYLCGGSLISDWWILTAAHCWQPGWSITARFSVHPDPDRVTRVEIKEAPVRFTENGKIHDIMLLKLSMAAPFRVPRAPLALCKTRLGVGDKIQVAGQATAATRPATEREPFVSSRTLQCADVNVVPCEEFKNKVSLSYPGMADPAHQRRLCGRDTRQPPQASICHGDAGGGVVDSANHKLYGVVAFTGDGHRSCDAAFAFMDVCAYMDWINQNIRLSGSG